MNGVTYIRDKNNRKKSLVIELNSIQINEGAIHELIDVFVAENRGNDELINWEDAKKQLKKKDKI